MFLRNWYESLKASCYGFGLTPCTFIDTSGVTRNFYNGKGTDSNVFCVFPQDDLSINDGATLQGRIDKYGTIYPYVYFGSGASPVTVDDYGLKAPYIYADQIAVFSESSNRIIKDNTVTLEYTYVLQNLRDENVIIAEIGIGVPAKYGSSGSNITSCLVDRTVLSEPVTIAPGASEQITYTLVYECPSPPEV